jgi:hypothetical protein
MLQARLKKKIFFLFLPFIHVFVTQLGFSFPSYSTREKAPNKICFAAAMHAEKEKKMTFFPCLRKAATRAIR